MDLVLREGLCEEGSFDQGHIVAPTTCLVTARHITAGIWGRWESLSLFLSRADESQGGEGTCLELPGSQDWSTSPHTGLFLRDSGPRSGQALATFIGNDGCRAWRLSPRGTCWGGRWWMGLLP